MLLNFSAGDDCTCPEELQEELQSFHDDLRLHCGKYLSILYIFYWHRHPITFQVTVLCFKKKNLFQILLHIILWPYFSINYTLLNKV